MPSIDIPGFHDFASANDATAALDSAHAQLQDAWIRWGVLRVAEALARHPEATSIGFPAGNFRGAESAFPSRFHAGAHPPGRASLRILDPTDQGCLPELLELPKETVNGLVALQATFDQWQGDRRFEPLMTAAQKRDGMQGDDRPMWITGKPDHGLDAKSLCLALSRADLWAAMEHGELGAAAHAGSTSKPSPRM